MHYDKIFYILDVNEKPIFLNALKIN